MTPLEQKIIDKFDKEFISNGFCKNKYLLRDGNQFLLKQFKQFILTSLQQQREETIKEIMEDLEIPYKEYYGELRYENIDRYSTDYKGGILRGYVLVLRHLQSLTKQLLVKNKI